MDGQYIDDLKLYLEQLKCSMQEAVDDVIYYKTKAEYAEKSMKRILESIKITESRIAQYEEVGQSA